jgi:hypothetical protein
MCRSCPALSRPGGAADRESRRHIHADDDAHIRAQRSVRLAIVDRPICFYNDAAVPRTPIDVSGMHPSGRVYSFSSDV